MQIIFTTVVPQTNFRSAKVKATASGNQAARVYVSVDAYLDITDAHTAALTILCRQLGWYSDFVGGHTKDGMAWVNLAEMSPRVTRYQIEAGLNLKGEA